MQQPTSPSRPILSVALITSAENQDALRRALARLAGEDPAFRILADAETGTIVLQAPGEMEIQSICDRFSHDYGIEIVHDEPQVIYLETIRKAAEGEGKYIRQTGGMGNYGHVKLRVEPNEAGSGVVFVNEIRGGVVPAEYIQPIEQGIRAAALGGVVAGHEVVDFEAVLYDGSHHEVDSNAMAFRIAGSLAFKEAAKKASPVVTEPMMGTVFVVSEREEGTRIAEISALRGRVEATAQFKDISTIQASIPLREMLRYEPRNAHLMIFSHYEPTGWPPDHGEVSGAAVRDPRDRGPRSGAAAADLDFD